MRLHERAAAPPPTRSSFNASRVIRVAIIVAIGWYGWRFISGQKAAALPWYQGAAGFEQAIAEQKSSGKPVLVYFRTDWCGYCKRLDHDVFKSSTFGQRYGSSLLKVEVNPEKGSAEASLAERYNLRGVPTVIVLASGNASQAIVGYGDEDRFYASLKQAVGN